MYKRQANGSVCDDGAVRLSPTPLDDGGFGATPDLFSPSGDWIRQSDIPVFNGAPPELVFGNFKMSVTAVPEPASHDRLPKATLTSGVVFRADRRRSEDPSLAPFSTLGGPEAIGKLTDIFTWHCLRTVLTIRSCWTDVWLEQRWYAELMSNTKKILGQLFRLTKCLPRRRIRICLK